MKNLKSRTLGKVACLIAAALIGVAFFGYGCATLAENPQLEATAFKLAGYKAAKEAIRKDADNAAVAIFVADAIDVVMGEPEILYERVEAWYREQRERIRMDPIERELLEDLVIVPLWEELKRRYGGAALDLTDPRVRADLIAFKDGVRLAVAAG